MREAEERMQELYGVVEAEQRRDRDEGGNGNEGQRQVLGTVEATLCSLLYDSDANHTGHAALDTSLDAVICDWINSHTNSHYSPHAALTQLDLGSQTPRDKARVIVSAHKIVVEGFTKIPLIRLKAWCRDRDATLPPMGSFEHLDAVTDNVLHVVVSPPGANGYQPESGTTTNHHHETRRMTMACTTSGTTTVHDHEQDDPITTTSAVDNDNYRPQNQRYDNDHRP
ncbi:hypothetical protein V8B97DRAFT_1920011 [Scleroderma yunnanense]